MENIGTKNEMNKTSGNPFALLDDTGQPMNTISIDEV